MSAVLAQFLLENEGKESINEQSTSNSKNNNIVDTNSSGSLVICGCLDWENATNPKAKPTGTETLLTVDLGQPGYIVFTQII